MKFIAGSLPCVSDVIIFILIIHYRYSTWWLAIDELTIAHHNYGGYLSIVCSNWTSNYEESRSNQCKNSNDDLQLVYDFIILLFISWGELKLKSFIIILFFSFFLAWLVQNLHFFVTLLIIPMIQKHFV